MLINLSIQNVAVIEKANADFSDGFNILTGETGAGKSLLIDSLSMVLGMRTSRELIRQGATSASVTALFSSDISLEEFDITPEEDGSIVLSRKISADGKNICKINSETVPLSTLRAVGEKLVSIHGQHDNISLLKPSYHLSLLDEYAGCKSLLDDYSACYAEAVSARERLEAMKTSESEREMKKDTLNFRIEEINAVNPIENEDELLVSRRDALRNFSTVMANLETAALSLTSQGGAKDSLYSSMRSMSNIASIDADLEKISERITDLYYNCEDIASEVNSYMSRMSFSPEELDDIEDRLDKITRLKKKYGPELCDVLNNLALWEDEYGALLFYDDNIAALEQRAENADKAMLAAGKKLHEARVLAAKKLSKAIEEELSFLDMPRVRFEVLFTEHNPTSKGLFDAEFMIATNPSESVKPLNKIASGGEMSRIMLALKSALSDIDDVGVLLFDEIDSGVSGRAAVKIAEKLKRLSEKRQVICITHLPQMASKAHCHLLVSKDTSSDSFRAEVKVLDHQGRVDELTRLISGGENTAAAQLAAREMLEG